ncbi:cAMP-responsive element-binding protein-like 2 [Oppia nitens]|uniref:cAMP-responsive element-binding protein-like 2 n=1 Tax=Oppia nitens TaxID=1686743 RepID=UPI0023DC6487|nr:cAMP-responsive element-binding protein-like 2 [Oppia nitens]
MSSAVTVKEEVMDTIDAAVGTADSQQSAVLKPLSSVGDKIADTTSMAIKSESNEDNTVNDINTSAVPSAVAVGAGSRTANTSYNNSNVNKRNVRKARRPGAKVDMRAKLERSRQSARECRARKKLRYQYLEDLVVKRELANMTLRQELQMYREISKKVDSGHKPQELLAKALDEGDKQRKNNRRA